MRVQCAPGKQDKADVSPQRCPHRAQPLAALEDFVTGATRERSDCERKAFRACALMNVIAARPFLSISMPTGMRTVA